MRFQKFLNEEEKYIVPKTKKFGFFQDNPMGGWLEDERARAKRSKLGGAVTAGFKEYFQIPTKFTKNLRGMHGEHLTRKLTDPDVKKLMKAIEVEGVYSPIFINVEYDGEALISEGNRRALISRTLGFDYIPVEIRYYAGGELIDTPWHPDSIVKYGKPWKRPSKPASILKAEKEAELRRIKAKEEEAKRKKEQKKKDKEWQEKEKELDPKTKELMDLLFRVIDKK